MIGSRGTVPSRGVAQVLALAAALPLAPAWAAAPVGTPVLRIERIDVSSPPRIRLFVTQVGQDGQVRPAPPPAQVALVVDGQPLATPELRVGTAKSVGEPLAVTFVLQDSSGMEAAFSEAQRSLLEIGDGLPAGSSVGLVSFTKTVRTALDPQAFSEVKGELSRLELDKDEIETQLEIGVRRGLDGLTGPKAASLPPRRVLLVVAEGLTSDYERTAFTALASRAKDNGVRIHAVGYHKFGEPEQPTLVLLTSQSKGTMRAYADPAGVREGLKAVGAELSDQWVIDIEQPRLFDGMRHDFQLRLTGSGSDMASEVERAVVPASDVGKKDDLTPILVGAGIALVVVVIVAIAVMVSRKRKAEAAQVLQNLQPVVIENTSVTDASAVQAALNAQRAGTKPVPVDDTEPPIKDRPVPILSTMGDHTGPVPEVRPPIIGPGAAGGAAMIQPDIMALPSPTQFLRRMDMEMEDPDALATSADPSLLPLPVIPSLPPAPRAGPAPAPTLRAGASPAPPGLGPPPSSPGAVPPAPKPSGLRATPTPAGVPAPRAFPPDDVTTPSFQSMPGLTDALGETETVGDADPASRAVLWALSDVEETHESTGADEATLLPGGAMRPPAQKVDVTVPPQAGLRSALNARLESGAMMLKTQVLMPTEGARSEAVAWLARLGSRTATIPLTSGHRIGAYTFAVDALGRWMLRSGEGVKLLTDGDALDLAGDIYVLKLATRLRPTPSTKDGLILIVGGPDDGRVISLGRGETHVVGAHPRAAVRVRGKQVAPQHLGLTLEAGKLRVADLGTPDGFKVDGQQVWKAALAPGQELQVGTVRLVFQRA